MKLTTLLAVVALTFSFATNAQITTIQEAYEVQLSSVRLPGSATGTLSFKACEECNYQTTRVSGNTRWMVNNQATTYAKFQAVVDGVADRDAVYITVAHNLESDRIMQVSIIAQ